ncbi:MAG TPA: adenylate kinase [Dehalococcoidia bacterium]|nr:adenylate kinase [Dehalococcoidia bacterium]
MQRINQPIDIGRRVVVWGATGSGKTTFTHRLGGLLGLTVVELDGIRHARGWDSTDWPEFRDILTKRLDGAAQGWVTDGSYSRIYDVYLSRADTLIWINLPWRVSFRRLLKRTVTRAWTKEPLYNDDGPRESWRLSFFDSRSILWWSISYYRPHVSNTRERIAGLREDVKIYELRSSREVAAFLSALEATAAALSPG